MSRVEEWQSDLASTGELTPAIVEQLLSLHGDRAIRAIEAVADERVKKYHDFMVVVGNHDEYIVEDGNCTCPDTRYNLDHQDPTDLCWHTIAVAIATRTGTVDNHDMWYSEVAEFV